MLPVLQRLGDAYGFWLNFCLLYTSARSLPAQVDRFWRSISHTTRFRPRMWLLGVSFILLPILGVKSPKDHILKAWIGILSLTCKIIIHTIEITAPITTKFCTVIKTTKYSTWVVPTRVKQVQDGGGRHLEKSPYCRDTNS